VPAALAVLAGVFFSVLVAVSAQRAAADAIRVGEMLRDFTALDDRGEPFSIASTAGRPLLLKFFRGHW
jgi:cytochrome oxidase Cu insertion factor (SCO1/SenC/PrrC family)